MPDDKAVTADAGGFRRYKIVLFVLVPVLVVERERERE
jgi:hypothetical protein